MEQQMNNKMPGVEIHRSDINICIDSENGTTPQSNSTICALSDAIL